jgi:hypothetical protein
MPPVLSRFEVMVDEVVAILDVTGIERVAVFAYEDGGSYTGRGRRSGPDGGPWSYRPVV